MPRREIAERPAYFRGQLLLEDDFSAEQQYHAGAMRRHSAVVHGWGVVRGLEVAARGDAAVVVGPGYAIDPDGHEIELAEDTTVDLAGLPPDGAAAITLAYEEEPEGADPRPRVPCYAVLAAEPGAGAAGRLVLATLRLDRDGRLVAGSIDRAGVRRVHATPGPGTVTAETLAPQLRRGWLRMPFRPIPLQKGPAGEDEVPPPFRVGTTEARSYDQYEGRKNDQGAGGSMEIALPPGARAVTRFRLAGEENGARIELKLVAGGWDPAARKHRRRTLVEDTIEGKPFERTYEVAEPAIDPEYETLSVWIRGFGKTSVSLIAVEVSY